MVVWDDLQNILLFKQSVLPRSPIILARHSHMFRFFFVQKSPPPHVPFLLCTKITLFLPRSPAGMVQTHMADILKVRAAAAAAAAVRRVTLHYTEAARKTRTAVPPRRSRTRAFQGAPLHLTDPSPNQRTARAQALSQVNIPDAVLDDKVSGTPQSISNAQLLRVAECTLTLLWRLLSAPPSLRCAFPCILWSAYFPRAGPQRHVLGSHDTRE
jgi:hypothetical protein